MSLVKFKLTNRFACSQYVVILFKNEKKGSKLGQKLKFYLQKQIKPQKSIFSCKIQ